MIVARVFQSITVKHVPRKKIGSIMGFMMGELFIWAALAGPLLNRCHGQVSLAWSPSPTPGVAGYYLCWGTNSGSYIYTNIYPNTQTNGTITNLLPNESYFFAAQSFLSNGIVGPFSSEVSFTTGPPGASSSGAAPIFVASTNLPIPISNNGPAQVNSGGVSPSTVSGNGSSGSISPPVSNSAASFWGVPPFLTMNVANGHPNLKIAGTVGATLMIQATTNLASPESWETVASVTLTNLAAAQSNQTAQAQNVLNLAFVPASQDVPILQTNSTSFQVFRVVMPYDYVILSSIVLQGQGYTPRLIVVNMPGIVCDDACYVNETAGYIHYDSAHALLQFEGCHSSIRGIADSLADLLNLDWTSASEFTFSNGLCQILATVVETEPPSSDPVAGQFPPSPPMVIDF